MGLTYSIDHGDGVIQVTVTGTWDYLSADRLWHDIVAACETHQCFDILGVSNTQQWSHEAAYDYPAIFAAAGVGHQHRIAWVQENPASKETMKLAEAVVRNRMLSSARVFDSVAEGRRWLAQEQQGRA